MSPETTTSRIAAFGPYVVDLRSGELRKHGIRLKLGEQPLQILMLLLQRKGDLVTREELQAKLWANDTFVDFGHSLNSAVQRLRDCLSDSAGKAKWIETVPRRGYRFTGKVEWSQSDFSIEGPLSPASGNGRRGAGNDGEPGALANKSYVDSPLSTPRRMPLSVAVGLVVLVLALGIGLNVGGVRERLLLLTRSPQIRSIAVLPLANLSGDPAQEYLADGMTDELITVLAKNRWLRVTSRTSVMQYKGVRRPLREIAKELGVDGVLEGSVMRSSNRVHMTVQLIYAPNDTHVWAESYDREGNGVVSLPREVALAISQELRSPSSSVPQSRYVSPEAHDAFLRGRYYWFSYHNAESAEYYRKAIALQPDYAAAWSGLASAYAAPAVGGDTRPQEAWPQAEAAAARAQELDDLLPDVHNSLAANCLFYRWDFSCADRESARAIELDPNFAEAHHLRSYVLHALNRPDEALNEQKKATEIDPFVRPWALGWELMRLRRFDAALDEATMRVAAHPDDRSVHGLLSEIYRLKGMNKESALELERTFSLEGDQAGAEAVKLAFARGGARGVRNLELSDLKKKAAKQYVPQISFAYAYATLGMKEETIHYLQLAYEEHSPRLIHMQFEPDFDFLHSDERYRSIVRKVGLPPAY